MSKTNTETEMAAPCQQPNEPQPELRCRICGAPKSPQHFVCAACYRRLPQNFRRGFAVLKLQSLWWLRQQARETANK